MPLPIPTIPTIPNKPSKRYFQLVLLISIASLIWRGCDFLDTHDLPFLKNVIVRVDNGTRTSTMAE